MLSPGKTRRPADEGNAERLAEAHGVPTPYPHALRAAVVARHPPHRALQRRGVQRVDLHHHPHRRRPGPRPSSRAGAQGIVLISLPLQMRYAQVSERLYFPGSRDGGLPRSDALGVPRW
eukprot:gene7155-biopygen10957